MTKVRLELDIPGVSDDRLLAGLKAAMAYFQTADIHPGAAADAYYAREGWHVGYSDEKGHDDDAMFDAWEAAESAAFEAVLGTGVNAPGCRLRLISLNGVAYNECEWASAAEADFMGAQQIHSAEDAPRDGTLIVGRDKAGSIAHVRWRTVPALEPADDDPHWSRVDDGDLFELVDWAPTALIAEDIRGLYGSPHEDHQPSARA